MNDDEKKSLVTRLSLNPYKAGLSGIDKDKVNGVIYNVSKGSKFFLNEQKRDQQTQLRISQMLKKYATIKHTLDIIKPKVEKKIQLIENSRDLSSTIIHIDMDAFYASVEIRDNPELANKPVAVGGMGMLSTASYEARKFGVRSAMPGYIAIKLCPQLLIIPPNYEQYKIVAQQIREIFAKYDANFCSVSLDEAYLNVTDFLSNHVEFNADSLSKQIRSEIFNATGLTASAGAGPNTTLAKILSDVNKPNGQKIIAHSRDVIVDFMNDLPIRKVCGIGKVTEKLLMALHITTCGQIIEKCAELHSLFSEKTFQFLINVALGIGSIKLESDRFRKSISTESTFSSIDDPETLINKLKELGKSLAMDLKKTGDQGKTITLKLKSVDFQVRTKSKTIDRFISSEDDLLQEAIPMLKNEFPLNLRLMGIRLSSLKESSSGKTIRDYFSEHQPSEMTFFVCPVCNKTLNFETKDTALINIHLDSCLNPPQMKKKKTLTLKRKKPESADIRNFFKKIH